jgi:CRP-like cAMP-binding protein
MSHQLPRTYPDQIDRDLLYAWGAVSTKHEKGDQIFMEGDSARYYYQIEQGSVRMFNLSREGKEYTQGMFYEGQSFGEPPLFIDEAYPASAMACEPTVVIRISKSSLMNLLEEYPPLQRSFLVMMSRRAYQKAISARDNMIANPEQRILNILKNCREQAGQPDGRIRIPYTRQELANFTGLRVETIIRTLSKMQEEGKVEIKNRKLYC